MQATSSGSTGLKRRVFVRLGVSLLIGGLFVWALRRGGLPLAPADALARTSWWGFPAYLGLLGTAAFFRTRRWYYLLQPLSPALKQWRVFGVGMAGFAAIFFAPLRLGEVVRPYLLSQDGDVTFVQAVGTVAAERVIDGLVVVAFTVVALATSTPLAHLPNRLGGLPLPISLVPGAIAAASVTFVLAFAAMATFYLLRDKARRLVRSVVGRVSLPLADLCSGLVERLAESLGFLPSWRRIAPFLRDTLLTWGTTGAGTYCLLRAVGLPSTVSQAFVTVGVAGLGSLLPAGPGFFGAYQVATYTSLAMFHPESQVLSQGAVFVFLGYLGAVAINAASGVLGLVLLARVPPERHQEESARAPSP